MNEQIYKNHEIKLLNRKSIYITGISKIENFNKNEFVLVSVLGKITIRGNSLELVLFDTDKSDVKIKGNIDSLNYTDSKKNQSKESLFDKLFK